MNPLIFEEKYVIPFLSCLFAKKICGRFTKKMSGEKELPCNVLLIPPPTPHTHTQKKEGRGARGERAGKYRNQNRNRSSQTRAPFQHRRLLFKNVSKQTKVDSKLPFLQKKHEEPVYNSSNSFTKLNYSAPKQIKIEGKYLLRN